MTSVPLTAQNMSEVPEPRANPNAQFLVGDLPHFEGEKSRLSGSLAVSVGTHVAGFLLFLFVIANMPDPAPNVAPREVMPTEIIWLNSPGPGGGGGGGGNKSPDPPKKAELPGKEKITVPVAKPPDSTSPTSSAPAATRSRRRCARPSCTG